MARVDWHAPTAEVSAIPRSPKRGPGVSTRWTADGDIKKYTPHDLSQYGFKVQTDRKSTRWGIPGLSRTRKSNEKELAGAMAYCACHANAMPCTICPEGKGGDLRGWICREIELEDCGWWS